MVKGRLVVRFFLLLLLVEGFVQSAPINSFGGLSHLTGTARKIRLYVKNRFLQILPDSTVNGTSEETQYSILQRSSVSVGQVKIQGVATCMFLCMDLTGLVYGSKEFSEECIFNEMIEQHHYTTYFSTKHSNEKKTFYLALNKFGLPRKTQLKTGTPLGKLSSYTQTLTQPVSAEEVEALVQKIINASPDHHGLRHHQLCPPKSLSVSQQEQEPLQRPQQEQPRPASPAEPDLRNRKRKKKRKRKKRKCKDGENEGDDDDEEGCTNLEDSKKKCDDAEGKCQLQKKARKRPKGEQLDFRRKTLLKHLHTISNHKRPETQRPGAAVTTTTTRTVVPLQLAESDLDGEEDLVLTTAITDTLSEPARSEND